MQIKETVKKSILTILCMVLVIVILPTSVRAESYRLYETYSSNICIGESSSAEVYFTRDGVRALPFEVTVTESVGSSGGQRRSFSYIF